MKNEPILTVLITAYNHEGSIKECIDSVLEQKTKYSFIIWLLEDHSTDGTLKICKQYADSKPYQIKLIAQPVNTKAKHTMEARRKISTKYFTILEGDDRWCDKNKIQIAINTLENNPKYSTFAHDTLYKDLSSGTERSLVHDIHKLDIKNPVTLETAPYLHTSSRVHRNVVDLNKHRIRGDIYLYYAFLDKGPLYYYDKMMSVYNITGKGMWSSLSPIQQQHRMNLSQYKLNKMLSYKYDSFFTGKVSSPNSLKSLKQKLGCRVGWMAYAIKEKLGAKWA